MDRTTTSPLFIPTRLWMGRPLVHYTSAAYCCTDPCMASAAWQARTA